MEPYATIRECNITVDRQKALKELFDLGDKFISADNEDFDSWNKAKKAILDLNNSEDVVNALKEAQKASINLKKSLNLKIIMRCIIGKKSRLTKLVQSFYTELVLISILIYSL